MADDRNLTAHTYNERIAIAIFGRLPRHLATLEAWLGAMTARMPASRSGLEDQGRLGVHSPA